MSIEWGCMKKLTECESHLVIISDNMNLNLVKLSLWDQFLAPIDDELQRFEVLFKIDVLCLLNYH